MNPILWGIDMRRLQQLLQAQIVFVNDVLYFSFKKHIFTGKVAKGGLIWKCTWQKPGEDALPVFANTSTIENQRFIRTFESLTDWTETCIQECLDEYHTRYSSWKRVRHQRTDQPMEILFKHLQKKEMTKDPSSSKHILLYEQMAAQTHHAETLTQRLQQWSEWFATAFPGQPLPIAPVEPPAAAAKETAEGERTQPFVLTSDTGQYMVLHRVHEVAPPECVSWLKRNGPQNFQNMLEKINSTVEFQPLSVSADQSKQFVHQFFCT